MFVRRCNVSYISFLEICYITIQINYLKNDVAKGINRNQLLNSILRVKEEKDTLDFKANAENAHNMGGMQTLKKKKKKIILYFT